MDLYPEEVYTFTPRGKVIVLPRDATPIDFAYAIHSDVGQTCAGAKVNGRIVPLRSGLRNGDIVEIITQAGHEPSKDWLAFVKTSRARNKIKHVINASERIKAIDIGQKYLDKEARRLGVALSKVTRADTEKAISDYGYAKMEDLYAALGYGKYSARQVLSKLAPGLVKDDPTDVRGAAAAPEAAPGAPPAPGRPQDPDAVIKVRGIDDLLVYRAKCCNPIRGEAIVGYVTRGKGVAVHSKMCPAIRTVPGVATEQNHHRRHQLGPTSPGHRRHGRAARSELRAGPQPLIQDPCLSHTPHGVPSARLASSAADQLRHPMAPSPPGTRPHRGQFST